MAAAMVSISTAPPYSHKQPSRKGKKAWRKNVDLTTVQQGLDDVREEIIKGGVIAEKEAQDLFTTDTTGDAEVAKQQAGKRLLKADEILAQRSAVPGLEGRKRKAEDDQRGVVASGKRAKNGKFVPHRELQRLRAVADGANGGVIVDENAASHDPWAETKETKDPRFSFVDEVKPKKEPKTLKDAPRALSANGKALPNVRTPDAGKSYNPLVGDWSALLEREGTAAVQAEQERLASEAKAAEQEVRAAEEAAKVEAAERDAYGTDYESEWDGFETEQEEVFTQKWKGRKTPAERNKVKARKEREAREKMEAKQRDWQQQERRIAEIAKEFSAADKAKRAHAMSLQPTTTIINDDSSASDNEAEVQLKRHRFGKLPVPDAPLEVVLPEDLEDSLRRLKPEGNLLTDRYRNLLVNGKVEVRKAKGKEQWKQPKKDRSEKWSYKDWRLR